MANTREKTQRKIYYTHEQVNKQIIIPNILYYTGNTISADGKEHTITVKMRYPYVLNLGKFITRSKKNNIYIIITII